MSSLHSSNATVQAAGVENAVWRPSAPSASAADKPKLKKFSHGFFDPEMASFRKLAFMILGKAAVISILVMWSCLPFYWGSVWKADRYTNKLTVRVIDRDGGAVGQSVTSGMLAQTKLRYFQSSVTVFPSDAVVAKDIVEEGAWAAIVIQPNVTAKLIAARQSGNASYDGSSALQVYYTQARQESAVNRYLLPYIQLELGKVVANVSTQSIAQYLATNSGNATAVALLAEAPTSVHNSVYYTLTDIRPYDQPVAQAITLVGLIQLLIFAFVITMNNNAVREIIAPYLTNRSYLAYRIVAPLTLYSVVSFFYAMVNLPFKVDFGAKYSYHNGFFLWAFVLNLGMASLGLATEFMITIIGPKFMPFFLIPLIIANVSVVSLPHELQPWIYRYGPAMPSFNLGRTVRTIIFDTKNQIGMDIGILIAWIVVSCCTITVATWLFRRKAVNQHRKEVGEYESDETIP
ncbi:hypothetical protein JCM24511_09516, partial [Saitozyma sp. JCM 24511]